MSEPRQIYGSNTASLSDFPEGVQLLLHLASKKSNVEASQFLVHFVASLLHDDFVCNLASIELLPAEYRETARDAFDLAISGGLTAAEKAKILAYIMPLMLEPMGFPPAQGNG